MPTPTVSTLGLDGGPNFPLIEAPLKIKILTHSSAASASGCHGVVFNTPGGSDMTGSRIGEFTGATFEASLEQGEAVLKVYCSEFGGGALTFSDNPVVVVQNTTYTTGVIPATIIEE